MDFDFSISNCTAKGIENDALMMWKDGFLNATSKVIAITFDGCSRLVLIFSTALLVHFLSFIFMELSCHQIIRINLLHTDINTWKRDVQ